MERRARCRVERDGVLAWWHFGVLIKLISGAGVVVVVDLYIACARGKACSEDEPFGDAGLHVSITAAAASARRVAPTVAAASAAVRAHIPEVERVVATGWRVQLSTSTRFIPEVARVDPTCSAGSPAQLVEGQIDVWMGFRRSRVCLVDRQRGAFVDVLSRAYTEPLL